VLLLDAFDFVSVTGDDPRFDVSDQAVLHMEDTNPQAIGVSGSATVPIRSLWQTDSDRIAHGDRHELGDAPNAAS
jgi:hypothetical protein